MDEASGQFFSREVTNMYEDKTLVCKECGAEFVFTAGEQEFYAERGFQNEPQRCKACRDARKNAARSPREYFTAVCANCGGEARVPFEPRRPIVRSTAASASQRCARTADLTCKPEPASRWGAGFSRFPVRESWTVLACGKVGFAEQKAGLAFFRAVWYALPVKIANNWILRHHSAFFPPYRAVKHKRESRRFPSRRKQQWTERNRLPP